jgi:diacylglycerol kinase (ATP)
MNAPPDSLNRAAVILNPNAGQGRLKKNWPAVLKELQKGFQKVQVLETRAPGDGAAFVRQAREKADVIIAAGGDGTVHELSEALASLEGNVPVFAVLPGGTCNDFSRALGMSQDPIEAALQLSQKKIRAIDIGEFDGHYFTNFWGIGLITHVSEAVNPSTKDRFGRLAYYLSAARSFQTCDPFHIQLKCEEFHFEGRAAMFLAVNGPFTGGMKPFFPDTDIQDGKLDCLLIEKPSVSFIWEVLQNRLTDSSFQGEGYHYFQTDAVQIQTTPHQLIDCDGEREHETPSTIRCLQQKLVSLTGMFPVK